MCHALDFYWLVLLQNEVPQSPIRLKMISLAIRPLGYHPWHFCAP